MAESGLDLRAVEARLPPPSEWEDRERTTWALLVHVRALRAALEEDPFGDGLVEVLDRAKEMLWAAADDASAPRYAEDLQEMGRILSGRAVRIRERTAVVLRGAQDPEG